jgi:alkylhydroperoxidase family enzyme
MQCLEQNSEGVVVMNNRWMSLLVPVFIVSLGVNCWLIFSAHGKQTDNKLEQPRIAPVLAAELTGAQQDMLAMLDESSRYLNIFTTMANHPELAKSWLGFAAHVLLNNSIPERERELLILRIGWLCQSEYEWGQHVRIGKAAGLTHEDIVRIMAGPDAQGISNLDKLLLQAADELHKSAVITDATWEALAEIYDTQQMMDVVFTVGQYNLVSMALNSFGVQLDEGIAGF